MKFSQSVISLIFMVLLIHSLTVSATTLDRTKVGVKKGDTFVYDFTDTIPENQSKLDPKLFHVRDANGDIVYLSDGQKLTISIDTPPSADTYVIFKFDTIDGTVKIQDKSDKYGQLLLFRDWQYWSSEITPDTNLFSSSENVTIINNSTNFGSSHTYEFNSSGGYFSVHAAFIYNKVTGMMVDLSYDMVFNIGNNTDVYNYGINLVSYTPASGSSDSTLFLIIVVIVIVGFFAYRRYKNKNNPRGQVNPQYGNHPNQAYQGYQQNQPTQPQYANARTADQSQTNNNPIQAKFCTNCGSTLVPGNQFCTECGTKI